MGTKKTKGPQPIMVECDECGGSGEHQASCEDCHVRLTTANQDADDPERCKACAKACEEENARHEHEWSALTLSPQGHHRRICRNAGGGGCNRIEVWAPAGSRRWPTWAWREARGQEWSNPKRASLAVAARWAKTKRQLARDMGIS